MRRLLIASLLVGSSAGLLAVIFPGPELNFLAWIALVPLLLLLPHCRPFAAFSASLVVGLIFYGALLWWLVDLQVTNPFNFALVILGNALPIGLFGFTARWLEGRIPQWSLFTLPACWVLLEYAHSHLGFLAFPWGALGYSQYNVLPIAGLAAFTGVYGVSYIIVAVNALIADVLRRKGVRSLGALLGPSASSDARQGTGRMFVAAAMISCLLLLVPSFSSLIPKQPLRELTVSGIQGNVRRRELNEFADRFVTMATYHRLTLSTVESRPQLVVWPESTVTGSIPSDRSFLRMISGLGQKTGAFVLVGASGQDKVARPQHRSEGSVANSAFLFSPLGQLIGRYDKIWLLPFNEYLPLRRYVAWPSWITADVDDAEPGSQLSIFDIGSARFGVLICWENLFPDLFRRMAAERVDFMVSMTNESFTDAPAARHQMLAMNVFRSIENHISIVRVASTGVSAVIEPSGAIVSRIHDANRRDVNIEGTLVRNIALTSERTFYTRYGDVFVYSLGLYLAIVLGFALRNRRSSTEQHISVDIPARRTGAIRIASTPRSERN